MDLRRARRRNGSRDDAARARIHSVDLRNFSASKIGVVPGVGLLAIVVNATRILSSSASPARLNIFKGVVIHAAPKSDTAATAAAALMELLTRVIQVHGLQRVGRRLRRLISVLERI